MPARRGMAALLTTQEEALATEAAALTAPPEPITGAVIPMPRETAGDGPLADAEQADLIVCEAALDNLRMAFWAAGKALQAIRDGRLYRDGYATFEAYCADRWEISRAEAYRLIAAWPLAERLSPIGGKLNKPQVLELLPVDRDHGRDAAAIVYETVMGTPGVTVTAATLHEVVAILPDGPFDAERAVAQIRAYLAGELSPPKPSSVIPVRAVTMVTARTIGDLDALQRAIREDPAAAHEAVTEIQAKLDEIKSEIGLPPVPAVSLRAQPVVLAAEPAGLRDGLVGGPLSPLSAGRLLAAALGEDLALALGC
jgi:hypothetical protein